MQANLNTVIEIACLTRKIPQTNVRNNLEFSVLVGTALKQTVEAKSSNCKNFNSYLAVLYAWLKYRD